MRVITLGCLLLLIANFAAVTHGKEILSLPTDSESRTAVINASEWLMRHVRKGRLVIRGSERTVSLIAWKDPTLEPDLTDRLAGYAITDTLWSSYALSLTDLKIAQELTDSLKTLNCLSNSLHEVIWQPVKTLSHKPVDADMVHGRSLGIMSSGEVTVDVRSFTMQADPDFAVGHPMLFAEHAVYQALHDFRSGDPELSKNRIRKIFKPDLGDSEAHIHWDAQRGLLLDYVIKSDYQKLLAGETNICRQYSFKLAVLLYAARLLGMESEFQTELGEIDQTLLSVQLPSGGMPHFFDLDAASGASKACPDATGEATAIFILAESVVPKY